MAYFANSSEGAVLDEQCAECIHEDPEAGCPVAFVQQIFNYDQIGNEDLEKAMNMLINKEGACQMKPFIDKLRSPKPKDTQLELWSVRG